MRSIVSIANGGLPPLAPGAGACGAINNTNSPHGTTKFISQRHSCLHVLKAKTLESALAQAHLHHAGTVSHPRFDAVVLQSLPKYT